LPAGALDVNLGEEKFFVWKCETDSVQYEYEDYDNNKFILQVPLTPRQRMKPCPWDAVLALLANGESVMKDGMRMSSMYVAPTIVKRHAIRGGHDVHENATTGQKGRAPPGMPKTEGENIGQQGNGTDAGQNSSTASPDPATTDTGEEAAGNEE
jgi:hypothetical protein